ncbi:hypothetical protein SAMN04488100_1269 [Alkalibacterium putridalgicola]|uniref:Uncharacterized protein n=1 Tax=Alkalibacterium putridalgicola TaxID=426703 RepID=A0A1H7VQ50_9LACT|nr:hypothetical protein [Alkalibacterium putridalgicola]GEK89837.1 hypothetical protein APU01nite_18760 [Alkalibacterium putridalgicola]SEM10908.1 hypothetical protein SAMN04488100_1269 [Alkalibacterium putridalgicola]
MSNRDANLIGLKIGLTVFVILMLPQADTVWWMILLIGTIQGVGTFTILDKVLERFHTDEYNEKQR